MQAGTSGRGGLWDATALANRGLSGPAASPAGALRAAAGMWRGLGATLARDVPFSAIYWGTVEPIRRSLLARTGAGVEAGLVTGGPGGTPLEVMAANVAAGGLAGSLAAAATTPLDVVKTQVQVAAHSQR